MTVRPPLDPFSEVVDVRRRWLPDWYGWLVELANGVNTLSSFSKTKLPSPKARGSMIYVTDDVGGEVPAFSDGLVWRRVTDRNVIS